jgi:hypothetical protein
MIMIMMKKKALPLEPRLFRVSRTVFGGALLLVEEVDK